MKDLTTLDFSNRVAPVDIEQYLNNKGIEYVKSGKWLKMNCILPFGHEDGSPSFFIHSEHGGYNCYVCGSGNWDQLCEHMNWEYSIDSISVGTVPEVIWKEYQSRIKSLLDIIPTQRIFTPPKGLTRITETDPKCARHWQYMKDRNILSLINVFNVGYTVHLDHLYGRDFLDRIIIPCHDPIGKYIWCEGRHINKWVKDRKYTRPDGVEKTKYLFNLHRVLKKGFKWVIVVEGIIDAMILWIWGYPAVCCYGAEMSDEQIQLLMAFDKVYLCLDNDPAGIKGYAGTKDSAGAKDKLLLTGIELCRIMMPKKVDINKLNDKEKFYKLYIAAKHIMHWKTT